MFLFKAVRPLTLAAGVVSIQAAAAPVTPQLDAAFGTAGVVTTDFPSSTSQQIEALAIDGQGRIVAAGRSGTSTNGAMVLARYLPDGTLDSNFSGDGLLSLSPSSYGDFAYGVSLDSTGNIVIVGNTVTGTPPFNLTPEFFIARYTSAGALDTSLNGTGTAQTAIGSSSTAYAVQHLQSGSFLVAGEADGEFVLAKYLADGSLDVTFGTAGIVTGPAGTARAMAVDSSGRILLAGHSNDFVLARYTPDGALDASFGSGGSVTASFGSNDKAYDLAIDSQGRIVVSGSNNSAFAVARFTPDGALDTSFSQDGVATHDPSPGNDFAYGALTDSADNVILMGSFTANFGLVRLDAAGELDVSFNSSGQAVFDIAGGGMQDHPYAKAVDSQGRLLMAGRAFSGSNYDLALARVEFEPVYDSDGVDAEEEDAVPNPSGSGTGDGNGDGIADSVQEQVVSFNAQSGGGMMTLASSAASKPVMNVQTAAAPGDAPDNLAFPFGFFGFTVGGVSPGATEQLSLFIPYNADIEGLWKQDRNGNWVDIASSVSQQGNKTRIDFSLTEGSALDFDSDSSTITDPAGPAIVITGPGAPPSDVEPVPATPLWLIGLLSGLMALIVGRRAGSVAARGAARRRY